MKRTQFTGAANRLHLQKTSRWSIDHVLSVIRNVVRAVAAEHALAQRAASKAELPRKNLAELRAACVPRLGPHRQPEAVDPVADGAPRAPATRTIRTDLPSWSSPFPKRGKAQS